MPCPTATALHESAHAFSAALVGGRIKSVELRGNGGGVCEWRPPRGISLAERLLVSVAGCAAECYATGGDFAAALVSDERLGGDRRVMATALSVAYDSAGPEVLQDVDRVLSYTPVLIELNWPAIVRLARELDRKGKISGREAHRLLQG